MKKIVVLLFVCFPFFVLGQNSLDTLQQDSVKLYKKRVLENTEISLLNSFYSQDGINAAVTGGIGSEKLDDFASNINVAIPLNDDAILTVDATISAYTSASSSNLNPFTDTGASTTDEVTGTPWAASSGASGKDNWVSGVIGYSKSSDDRNKVKNASVSFATEYDYTSVGVGGGFTRLLKEKNTKIDISTNLFFDVWRPEYPTEIKTFIERNGDLNAGFFTGVDILDQNGDVIDKEEENGWKPLQDKLIEKKGRNTFSLSLSFSQILSKRAQMSVFTDVVIQQGWLANPMQRVYFSDIDNFYIGNAESISNYTNESNQDVFQLADDIERLPNTRFKIPIGVRLNYYINEFLVLKTYYRYYTDDWGIKSNTFNIELPVKLGMKFTLYPNVRIYNQTAADYFAPYEKLISTQEFYTSDYDLSKFTATQYGIGIKYTDVFTKAKFWKIGLKNVSLNYSYYSRDTGLDAYIVTMGVKFVLDPIKNNN